MPPLYILAATLLFLFSGTSSEKKIPGKVYLKCYGYSPCKACTSCNYCAHCNAGGSCGVCKDLKEPTTKKEPVTTTPKTPVKSETPTGQCKATTKKGTRCSRSAKSNGYCWQHGG